MQKQRLKDLIIKYSPSGPQPVDAKVLTPSGWRLMGDIQAGDRAIGRDGKSTMVLGVCLKGVRQVYRVRTTEGAFTECCGDHPWSTTNISERKYHKPHTIRTTRDMMNDLKIEGKVNYHIPRNETVEFSCCGELPVPAYVLGVLLGDGSLSGRVSFSSVDDELIERVAQECESFGCIVVHHSGIVYNIRQRQYSRRLSRKIIATDESGESVIYASNRELAASLGVNHEQARSLARYGRCVGGVNYKHLPHASSSPNPIKSAIESMGLMGKRAWEKGIPVQYQMASVADRLSLLRGLMDTDGTAHVRGSTEFGTTSDVLAKDVVDLVRSLGGRATLRKLDRSGSVSTKKSGETICTRRAMMFVNISMPVDMNPFYITRKCSRFESRRRGRHFIHGVGIDRIEPAGEKECRCILIENPEHLYITDGYIVTHNTIISETYKTRQETGRTVYRP